jgi:predicted methyltransferase
VSQSCYVVVALALVLAGSPGWSDEDPLASAIAAAMASDIRTEEERARDANRKPVETLAFFGLEADMRVLELFPGGGWYSKLLGPVLREDGKLYAYTGGRDALSELIASHGSMSEVEVVSVDAEASPTQDRGIYDIGAFEFPVRDIDMVLTFRNLHNFTPNGRANLYRAAFGALRPGGRFGVIDHTRRHMAPDTREVWRRLDPVLVIQEAQRAGFELVGFSDLHYRPDDELRYEVGRGSVKGNSDRFTLLFRRPE